MFYVTKITGKQHNRKKWCSAGKRKTRVKCKQTDISKIVSDSTMNENKIGLTVINSQNLIRSQVISGAIGTYFCSGKVRSNYVTLQFRTSLKNGKAKMETPAILNFLLQLRNVRLWPSNFKIDWTIWNIKLKPILGSSEGWGLLVDLSVHNRHNNVAFASDMVSIATIVLPKTDVVHFNN